MCQFRYCGTETEPSGYCTVCGKEICPDCEDTKNPKKHVTCFRDEGGLVRRPDLISKPDLGGISGPSPADAPYPK